MQKMQKKRSMRLIAPSWSRLCYEVRSAKRRTAEVNLIAKREALNPEPEGQCIHNCVQVVQMRGRSSLFQPFRQSLFRLEMREDIALFDGALTLADALENLQFSIVSFQTGDEFGLHE
jgi:hypothetical protein